MRRARVAVGTGSFVALLAVACVGGPGQLPDQGIDQASQGGGVVADPSGSPTGDETSSGTNNGGNKPPPGKPPVILRAGDYDQDCEVDTDCVAIFEGNACTSCACPNAAIASKDASKYSGDRTDAAKDCPDPGDVACTPCESPRVGCNPNTKKCGIGVSSSDAGG